jgi:hypothetical protein
MSEAGRGSEPGGAMPRPNQALPELPLVLGEVAADDCEVEGAQDGFLRLALQEEVKGLGDQGLRAGLPAGKPLIVGLAEGHAVSRLCASLLHGDLEFVSIRLL